MIKGLKELYYYHQNLIEHSGISKDGLLICDEKNTFYKSHENLFTRFSSSSARSFANAYGGAKPILAKSILLLAL